MVQSHAAIVPRDVFGSAGKRPIGQPVIDVRMTVRIVDVGIRPFFEVVLVLNVSFKRPPSFTEAVA